MHRIRERQASAEARLDRMLDLQNLLAKVSRQIGPALELEPVLQTILGAMRSLVEFRTGSVLLVDEEGVYVAASDPAVERSVGDERTPIGDDLAGRCITTRSPVYSSDVAADSRVDDPGPANSYLAVPLTVMGDPIGLLQVDSLEKDAFTTDDLAVLEGLATLVAGAIATARRYEELKELERLKSDFIARVSHELRTPLTIISGFAQTLQAHGDQLGPDGTKRAILKIGAAADRLSGLIDELLTVASFEAGVTRAHDEFIEVARLLETVKEQSTIPGGVTVDCPIDLRLLTDAKLLAHALGLLVDNALKYAGHAELAARADAAGLVVTVRDHGQGVPDHLRGRIFERFVRGEHTEPGMGLGLAVALRLVTAVGATIDLEDTPGGGATFAVRFSDAAGR